jgi:hypothetical protein
MKKRYANPNFDNKDNDKKFILKSDEDNKNCPCWVCKEQIDKIKNIQRQNFALSVFIGFGQ